MSLVQSGTLWFLRNEPFLAASSPWTGDWYNAEALNAGQFFFEHAGAANTVLSVDISPIQANGLETDANGVALDPSNAFERISILASGAHGTEGFCFPAAGGPWDYPFKSWRMYLTTDANITAVYFCLCRNILAGG